MTDRFPECPAWHDHPRLGLHPDGYVLHARRPAPAYAMDTDTITRRMATARALASNMRHRAYGRYVDGLDPFDHVTNPFMPGRLPGWGAWALHTKRAYQHDPSDR